MAFTARLPESVEVDAKAYAEYLGVSLNALLAVALRDYLDSKRFQRAELAPQVLPPKVEPAPAVPT